MGFPFALSKLSRYNLPGLDEHLGRGGIASILSYDPDCPLTERQPMWKSYEIPSSVEEALQMPFTADHVCEMVKKIYDSLEPNGLFIFSEKVIVEDKVLDKEFIDIYYDYKKAQGYSEFEIMQKREALENVLVPYTYEENVQMLHEAGFTVVDTLFRWVNFTTFIAKKI